jgi:hypothetical protein
LGIVYWSNEVEAVTARSFVEGIHIEVTLAHSASTRVGFALSAVFTAGNTVVLTIIIVADVTSSCGLHTGASIVLIVPAKVASALSVNDREVRLAGRTIT